MPGKRKRTMDIREILRHLRQGQSDRAIAATTGVDRKTVARYRVWAIEHELLDGPLPLLGELNRLLEETLRGAPPPQNVSSVEPYREMIGKLRAAGVEVTAIHQRLQERGYSGSYSSVRRFVHRLEPPTPKATVRVETRPGEEGQVDFGYAGRMIDPETGELRRAWAFVMVLSWSRHAYVEFAFDQTVETWLRLHRNAFAFFGGTPERVVIDNLRAGIARVCFQEPQAQHAYRECAEHYGFLISPCRPRTPQHKGKVEQGGVHYVKRNFLAGREPMLLPQANREVLHWVETTAGKRIHGTTKEQPLVRFATERQALLPLPPTPYDLAVWKQVKLHRDCYVAFEQAHYSAPFRLVGQRLWVRGATQEVQVYTSDYQLVATHPRAQRRGQRLTNPDHLPPHKLPGLILSRDGCRQRAADIGPAAGQVVDRFLDHRPEDRLRMAGRLLRLADRFGANRLEAACARALDFDDPAYLTIKRILEQGLDVKALPSVAPAPPARVFVRTSMELVGHLQGGVSWN
jgi:transposase